MTPDVAFSAEVGRMLCAGDWTLQAMCKSKTALFFALQANVKGVGAAVRRLRVHTAPSAPCRTSASSPVAKVVSTAFGVARTMRNAQRQASPPVRRTAEQSPRPLAGPARTPRTSPTSRWRPTLATPRILKPHDRLIRRFV